jgi:flavin reductase (DIM6/NTAB) family NADH-FMN oxidoreductase RutF
MPGETRFASVPAPAGEQSLREVMARFATGVTVLTASGAHTHGMTANAFSSVSLDPPLVLCCVARNARMHDAITSAGGFAVSLLGADQEDVARYFADPARPAGLAQFDAVDWRAGTHTAAPLLGGAMGWLECGLAETHPGGDHSIFVGEVVRAECGSPCPGLVFFDGRFRTLVGRPASARGGDRR